MTRVAIDTDVKVDGTGLGYEAWQDPVSGDLYFFGAETTTDRPRVWKTSNTTPLSWSTVDDTNRPTNGAGTTGDDINWTVNPGTGVGICVVQNELTDGMGGFTRNTYVSKFDPATDTWTYTDEQPIANRVVASAASTMDSAVELASGEVILTYDSTERMMGTDYARFAHAWRSTGGTWTNVGVHSNVTEVPHYIKHMAVTQEDGIGGAWNVGVGVGHYGSGGWHVLTDFEGGSFGRTDASNYPSGNSPQPGEWKPHFFSDTSAFSHGLIHIGVWPENPKGDFNALHAVQFGVFTNGGNSISSPQRNDIVLDNDGVDLTNDISSYITVISDDTNQQNPPELYVWVVDNVTPWDSFYYVSTDRGISWSATPQTDLPDGGGMLMFELSNGDVCMGTFHSDFGAYTWRYEVIHAASTNVQLDGSGAVSASGSGTLTAVHPLDGSGPIASNGSGILAVTTHISGTGDVASDGVATLSIDRMLEGTGDASSSGTGDLTVEVAPVSLDGAGATSADGSGSLDILRPLAGTGSTASDGSSTLIVTRGLAGTGDSSADGDGTIVSTVGVTGSGASSATGSGDLTVVAGVVSLDGPGAVSSAGSGAIGILRPIAGTGSISADGSGEIVVTVGLSGSGAVASNGFGSLDDYDLMSGSGAASSSGTGFLSVTIALAGDGPTASDGAGDITVTNNLDGSGASSSSGTGMLGVTLDLAGTGEISSDGQGNISLTRRLVGAGDVASDGTANLSVTRALSGTGDVAVTGTSTLDTVNILTMYATGDGTITDVVNELDTTTNLWESINDDPSSPNDTDWINNTDGAGNNFIDLTNVPASFVSMDSLEVTIRYRGANFGTGTVTLYGQVFRSDESTALSDEVAIAFVTTDGSEVNTTAVFTGLDTGAGAGVWDGAKIRWRWAIT